MKLSKQTFDWYIDIIYRYPHPYQYELDHQVPVQKQLTASSPIVSFSDLATN
jgi:hypothetical protein